MNLIFTQIPDKLPYPASMRGKLSTIHSSMVLDISKTYDGSFRCRRNAVNALNTVSYMVLNNYTFEYTTLDAITLLDPDVCKSYLGELYLDERLIDWDIEIVEAVDNTAESVSEDPVIVPIKTQPVVETPKEDLYIRAPLVPKFDVSKVVVSKVIDNIQYTIYTSLPEVPTVQSQISCTTDVNKFTTSDLRKLFPNQFIQTRASIMYSPVDGLDFHPQLGVILPIDGFSKEELIQNLIQYPHIFKLQKIVGGDIVSFYTTLEIDGELHRVSEIWKDLPESSVIPYTADFVKEYVVRRYLLERDIKHIEHKYPLFGTLDPYLTLFTNIDGYIRLGVTDIEKLARQCVCSRVSYKSSRNPIMRKVLENV